jgi:murein DD-endopeptidase MepM/ murein hydrolase activator NlpD
MEDIVSFLLFFKKYIFKRVLDFGQKIEVLKSFFVAILIVKRGKYTSSFLNTSFLILIVTILIAGPTLAENNPFVSDNQEEESYFQTASIGIDPFDNPITTVESEKPRDKVVSHTVSSGETLGSLAKKFDVTIDTIKWANNLKSDTIKPGQKLNIPPGTGVVHKVVAGESIYSIAKKYKVDAQNIVNFPFNDFSNFETFQLTLGQTLFVPDGVIEEARPSQPRNFRFVAKAQAGVSGTSSFIWPTSGNITQYPVGYHMALDIANRSAPAIIASDTGTVIYTGCLTWGYGCHVIVDHGNGYQSLYAHLSAIDASAGQVVGKGQRLGVMGSTGRSTGIHLHFEIRQSGRLLNPLSFLQ